jgi:hypothetical protein
MTDRKKLIKEYKETPTPMGILQIRNNTNGKAFLIKAKNLPGIINSQKFSLKNGSHPNADLQKEFNHFGEASFAFEIIDRLEPREGVNYDYTKDLQALEEMWMEKLQPFGDKGYHSRR